LESRMRTFANGAAAMRALALQGTPRSIGCTQASEILCTEGVDLVAALPARFELATLYSGAVCAHAAEPALAARLIEMLTGAASRALREAGGFEP
jgi:molybdate transport system substrate-binding protein